MHVYLAGMNYLHPIIERMIGGGQSVKDIKDENFWRGGESRHWLHSPQTEVKPSEDISGRKHAIPEIYRSDAYRGGFSEVDENIPCRYSPQWGGKKGYYKEAVQQHKPFILESFYYTDADTEKLLPYYGDFLLDSGAFTYMQGKGKNVNWNEYVQSYIDFINRNDIEKFFELDIDSIIGYENVLEIRREIERQTKKQCIPVWHPSRGKDEFLKMCEEYPYVALGGIVGAGNGSKAYREYQKMFPWFIKQAHKCEAKIHGLGYTALEGLKTNHFDSVDSTAWTTGNRFGFLYYFNGKTMVKKDVPKEKRFDTKKARDVARHNYSEWIKFQKYAEVHL